LNDEFDKLPEGLKEIIDDPEKRKKLIIYINPPYAEVSSKNLTGKPGVNQSKTHEKYCINLGTAGRELFTQFLTRIIYEIPDCKIGEFSTLKGLAGPAFDSFREYFKAKLLKCFIVPAYTFDNVNGKFPIGFKIWDTETKEKFNAILADVFDEYNNSHSTKTIFAPDKNHFINKWISEYKVFYENPIGYMDGINANDFQNYNKVYFRNKKELIQNPRGIWVTEKNLIGIVIYYSIRHCIEPTWLNDRDQFLYPSNDKFKKDINFQNDCLAFSLFHGQNRISAKDGKNHWIPFTAQEVNAKDNFKSDFMSNFLKGKKFGKEAKDTINAGKELWKYYHSKISGHRNAINDASFYDIREFFQGRSKTKGTMNTKSSDETYNTLIKNLRQNLSVLAEKIQPKVYEYGFLGE
jgi:hypothetical protein